MTFRARCPTCGRKQSAQLSQAGQTLFCAACGTRFVVELTEQADDESTIPDIDFFPPVVPAADPPPAISSPAVQALTPAPTPLPLPLPPWPSVPVAPPPQSAAMHEPFVEKQSRPSWLLPLIIGGVLAMGVMLAVGITVGYLISRPKQPAVAVDAGYPLPPKPVAGSTPIGDVPKHANPAITNPAPRPTTTEAAAQPDTTLPAMPAPAITENIPVVPPPPPKFRPVHPAAQAEDLDDKIGKSLDTGVTYLLNQFANGRLKRYSPNEPPTAGMDALAVYALLHAGEATHDLRLSPNTTLVAQMLDALKQMPMDHEVSTYSRSLRAAALGVYHRSEDKNALRDDCTWLIADSHNGAYSYDPPPPGGRGGGAVGSALSRFTGGWDNSNSQYGALGVWAALEAGVEVPNSYWTAVQKHWLSCQLPDGEWAYTGYGAMGRLSMTVAGITTLLVTEDQLDARAVITTLGHEPYTPALTRGLNWLEAGNNSVRLPNNWRTYNLFGLERAALASGYKYFGSHDWYRELAIEQLGQQQADGSWVGFDPIVDTSYTLLFLSRGRHPIFMNKLRFDGYWANRPRDIANLAHYASSVLERPLNWQVVSLKSDWSDWMDSPVLYIASHEALKFSDDDIAKLRSFAENGGLIFTHADGDSQAFNKSIAEAARRLFPQYPLTDLPATHPIFSSLYKIKLQPRLQGISNGSRLLLVHSPTELNKVWQLRDTVMKPVDFQMGVNIFIYAAGRANLRNRLKTPLVPEPQVNPILTTTIAQIRHLGDWNPEPAAFPRFARLFMSQTSVKVNVLDVDPQMLDPQKMPLAHLTGTGPMHLDAGDLKAIHDYVDNGGTLLIDACGGSIPFRNSIVTDFLPHAFSKTLMAGMPIDDPILDGKAPGMSKVALKLSPWRTESDGTTTQPLEYLTEGKGIVIFCTVDLTTALLGTNTWGINGYEPECAYGLVQNVLLSILER